MRHRYILMIIFAITCIYNAAVQSRSLESRKIRWEIEALIKLMHRYDGDSTFVKYTIGNRRYPYQDTLRYDYSDRYRSSVAGAIEYYEGDTVRIGATITTLLQDTLFINVGNCLPNSIYFRIFEYSDFSLSDSIPFNIGRDMEFIYLGRANSVYELAEDVDSSNFYLFYTANNFDYYSTNLFFDIVGLPAGIYEILPTFTIIDSDSQEYGYKFPFTTEFNLPWRSSADTIVRRETQPIYIREKVGWIDTVNVLLADAYRYGLDEQMDKAIFLINNAREIYPESAYAVELLSWVYGMHNDPLIKFKQDQMKNLYEDLLYSGKDWYIQRFYAINHGILIPPQPNIHMRH